MNYLLNDDGVDDDDDDDAYTRWIKNHIIKHFFEFTSF